MSGALSVGVSIGLSVGVKGLMSGGAIKRIATVLPHDAPATMPGETPWYSGELLPVQIGVYKRLSVGEVVLYASGSSARQTKSTKDRPVDATIMAIVDAVESEGQSRYIKDQSDK